MGEVLSFIDKLKRKQADHEAKATKAIEQARECERAGNKEWMLTYVNLAAQELDVAIDLKKQILNIESPPQHITTLNIKTAAIEQSDSVDFL